MNKDKENKVEKVTKESTVKVRLTLGKALIDLEVQMVDLAKVVAELAEEFTKKRLI